MRLGTVKTCNSPTDSCKLLTDEITCVQNFILARKHPVTKRKILSSKFCSFRR